MQLLINSEDGFDWKKKRGGGYGEGGGKLPLLKLCTLVKAFCLLKNNYKIFYIYFRKGYWI